MSDRFLKKIRKTKPMGKVAFVVDNRFMPSALQENRNEQLRGDVMPNMMRSFATQPVLS